MKDLRFEVQKINEPILLPKRTKKSEKNAENERNHQLKSFSSAKCYFDQVLNQICHTLLLVMCYICQSVLSCLMTLLRIKSEIASNLLKALFVHK